MKIDLNKSQEVKTYQDKFFERYLENAPISLALIRAVECRELSQENYLRPVLDFGSGEGLFSSILFKDSIDIGLDISQNEIKGAQKTLKYNYLVASNIEQVSFKDGSFSTIISNSVFEHLNDLNKTLKEIYRILKKDGVLIFTTYTGTFSDNLFYSNLLTKFGFPKFANFYVKKVNQVFNHKKLISQKDWEKLLTENGFQVLKLKKFLPKKTMKIFGLFLPFSLLNLLCKKLFSKWKLFSIKIFTKIVYFFLKNYSHDDTSNGCGIKFVVKKS